MPSIIVNFHGQAVTHPSADMIEEAIERMGYTNKYDLEDALEEDFLRTLREEFGVDPEFGEAPGYDEFGVSVEVDY